MSLDKQSREDSRRGSELLQDSRRGSELLQDSRKESELLQDSRKESELLQDSRKESEQQEFVAKKAVFNQMNCKYKKKSYQRLKVHIAMNQQFSKLSLSEPLQDDNVSRPWGEHHVSRLWREDSEPMPQHVSSWYEKHGIHESRYIKCVPLSMVFDKLKAKGFSGPFLPVYMFVDAGSWGFYSYYIVKCSQNFYHVFFSADSSCTSHKLIDDIDTLPSLNDFGMTKEMKSEMVEDYEVYFFKNHYSQDRKNTPHSIMHAL